MRTEAASATGWRSDALALLAGALLPVAFAPFEYCLTAIVSLAVLFAVLLGQPERRAAWRGYLFGLGMFGVGTSWVFVSIYRYSEVGLVVAVLLTAAFVAILAFYPALFGYLAARLCRRAKRPVALLLILPALWMLIEWVRGWFLTGFPWLDTGYSQFGNPLGWLAPIVGVYGVGWVAALSAGILALGVRLGWRGRGYGLAALLAIWGAASLTAHIEWTQPQGRPLTVGIVQGNVAQDAKWLPEQRWPTFELYTGLTRQHWGADLIVWPETALPVFYHQAQDYVEDFAAEAREHGTDLVYGVPVWEPQSGRFFNSLATLGSHTGFYHKRHLVPFGEYLPLEGLIGPVLDILNFPMSSFSSGGPDQPLLQAAGVKIGGSICYEIAFGEEIIQALPEANLLVNVSNDAWFGASLAPHQHLQMARWRARETGRWILRATNTGISALIDHRGELRGTSPQFEVYVLRGEVQPRTGATPYVRYGNWPALIVIFVALAVGAFWPRAKGLFVTG